MQRTIFFQNQVVSTRILMNANEPKLFYTSSRKLPGEKFPAKFYGMPDGVIYRIYQTEDNGEFIICEVHGFSCDPLTGDIIVGCRWNGTPAPKPNLENPSYGCVMGDMRSLAEALETLMANHDPSDGYYEFDELN